MKKDSSENRAEKKYAKINAGEKIKETLDEILITDRGIWKRFFKMLWKSRLPWLWIAAYIALSIGISYVGVSVTEYTSEMIAGNLSFVGVILPFIGYTIINIFTSAISTCLSYLCQARIDRNLRRMVWAKIVRLPMSYFDNNRPKELITRITSDVSTISSLIITVIIPVFTGLANLFIIFQKVGNYDSSLMWSLLIVVPFVFATAFMMGRLRFGVNDKVNQRRADMTAEVSEKVNNIPLVKAFATEEKESKSGIKKMFEYYKTSIKSSWITYLSNPIYTIIGVLQIIVIVLVGRTFYQNGSITLAQWVAYFAFAQQVANQLQAYAGYWASFKSSQGATRRVTYIMDEINETLGPDRSADDMKGGFSFNNVSFSYGDNKVIDNVSLTIPEGKITAFIGMSGGGKTTMMNLLERFYVPQEGSITVGGEDINSYNMKSYRSSIAYITQESFLLSGTIKQNLLYGVMREVSDEEIDEACRAANAYDFIMSFPEKYETEVGEGGGRLSGGQKQRIAIARAMLKNPKYMFLDEATAAMDAKTRQEVWYGLENLMRGKTTVMIAHDYLTASHADYIVIVDKGKIADTGTQAELYERNEYFRKFVDMQEVTV